MLNKSFSHLKKVERSVLKVYSKENPSTYKIDSSRKEYERVNKFIKKLFLKKLNFPEKMFKNSSLLDFGTGTGENSLHYLLSGAKGTFVEVNHKACLRAKKIFDKFAPKKSFRIINKSLFDYKCDKKFDIVSSLGVIHHTSNKEKAFKHKVSFLKKGGFIILGIANSAGFFQRNLQRSIIYKFSNNDEEIENLAEELFSDNLDRAEKFGKRSRKAIIYDTYVNPCIDAPSTNELLDLFQKNKISLYSSWPPISPFFFGDSPFRDNINPSLISNIMSIPEIIWMQHNEDDINELIPFNHKLNRVIKPLNNLSSYLNNIRPRDKLNTNLIFKELNKITNKKLTNSLILDPITGSFNKFINEVKSLLSAIEDKNLNKIKIIIKNSKYLFKGTNGLGMNYYIGHKD